MARLVLIHTNGTTFEIRPNEMETLEMTTEPVMDASGMEVLYHKVKLDMRAVINPLMLATNQPTLAPALAPPPGALAPAGLTVATGPGDRAGLTARAITQFMANARPLVQYWIGPDLVLEAPERLDAAGTSFLSCDPMGGPFVRHCRCYEIKGDKTIFLNLSLELATTAFDKVLLSNRWSMTADIDSAGFTTRTISGVAKFRLDALTDLNILPDDFRNLLLVPTDLSLRRIRCNFTADDDQQTYRYQVVDRETSYGMGSASGIEKIDGTISLTKSAATPSMKDLLKRGVDVGGSIVAGAFRAAAMSLINLLIDMSLADVRMACAVRVQGMNGASQQALYAVAMKVFNAKIVTPLGRSGTNFVIASLTVTQWIGSEDQPIIEVRANGVAVSMVSATQLQNDAVLAGFMDLSTGIPAPVGYSPASARTALPSSSNARGAYGTNIMAQALTAVAGDLPPAAVAPPVAINVLGEF